MTSNNRFQPAAAQPADNPSPLPHLVEMLLGLLLHDIANARSAQLSVDGGPGWLVGEPRTGAHLVSVTAPLGEGRSVTLAIQADLDDDTLTRAQLARFIPPLVACMNLEHSLRERTQQAREAVTAIERTAVLDLATGIVMARRNCDQHTARELLVTWSAREGVDLASLTPEDVLERLAAD